MYEDIDKYKEKKRYLSVPKRKEKSMPKGFSPYPILLLSAVRFFTMAMRRLSMAVG